MPGMSQQKSVIDYGELANWIFLPPYIGLFPLSQVFYLKVSAQSSKAQVDASCGCLVSMVIPFSWQLCSIYSLLHISLYSPLSLRRRRRPIMSMVWNFFPICFCLRHRLGFVLHLSNLKCSFIWARQEMQNYKCKSAFWGVTQMQQVHGVKRWLYCNAFHHQCFCCPGVCTLGSRS